MMLVKVTAKMRDDLRNYKGKGAGILREQLMSDVLDDLDKAVALLDQLKNAIKYNDTAVMVEKVDNFIAQYKR